MLIVDLYLCIQEYLYQEHLQRKIMTDHGINPKNMLFKSSLSAQMVWRFNCFISCESISALFFKVVKRLPKTRSGKIMRRILRKVAMHDTGNLGDISTLDDPSVVSEIIEAQKCYKNDATKK